MKMSTLIAIVVTAALASSQGLAQTKLSYEQAVAYCKSLGEMARTIMENRQLGVAREDQLGSFASLDNEHWQQLGAKLVEVAYQSAAHTDAGAQKRAADEFRNEYEQACYKIYLD